MNDKVLGGIGDDAKDNAVGKGIQQQRQSFTVRNERDLSVALELLAMELRTMRHNLQTAVFVGLLILLVAGGLVIFFGDRQVSRIDQRVHDLEIQLQRMERRIESLQRGAPYTPPPYYELP